MKKNLYITLFAAAALGFSACKSDVDNFMVDDTIGFLSGGLVEKEVYTGVDDPTKVYVVKAGKGFQSATATVAVDDVVLTEYNALPNTKAQIAALPADCYTITVSSITFTNGDYRLPFEISWNRERLAEELANNPNLGIPLRMTVTTDARIAENRLTTIIKPVIEVPYIAFTKAGLNKGLSPTRADASEKEIYFEIKANFIAQRDIEYTLEVDPAMVDEYNEKNKTSFTVLPEDAYDLQLEGTIKQYLKSDLVKMTFKREALIPSAAPSKFGEYMLPVRIKSLSSSQLDPERSVMYYTVNVDAAPIEKGKWTIVDCNSNINDDPGATDSDKATCGPEALIDGNNNTYWRSVYTEEQDLPYYVTVDLGRKTALSKLGLENPGNSAGKKLINSKAGRFEASVDGQSWEIIGNWNLGVTTSSAEFIVDCPKAVRYVKFVVTETHKPIRGITNPNATIMAELNALGEVAVWETDNEE